MSEKKVKEARKNVETDEKESKTDQNPAQNESEKNALRDKIGALQGFTTVHSLLMTSTGPARSILDGVRFIESLHGNLLKEVEASDLGRAMLKEIRAG